MMRSAEEVEPTLAAGNSSNNWPFPALLRQAGHGAASSRELALQRWIELESDGDSVGPPVPLANLLRNVGGKYDAAGSVNSRPISPAQMRSRVAQGV
jgi:hypothetical protein